MKHLVHSCIDIIRQFFEQFPVFLLTPARGVSVAGSAWYSFELYVKMPESWDARMHAFGLLLK
jgi:hypothetical protein